MRWLLSALQGMSASLRIQESPLYRYPYRSGVEAFRGDMKRIASDIETTMERYGERSR